MCDTFLCNLCNTIMHAICGSFNRTRGTTFCDTEYNPAHVDCCGLRWTCAQEKFLAGEHDLLLCLRNDKGNDKGNLRFLLLGESLFFVVGVFSWCTCEAVQQLNVP